MIYIHQVGCINYKEDQSVDLKAECKLVAPKFIRRTDDFIQLGILGVEQIAKKTQVNPKTALYLTSGQGNTGVFMRLCEQQLITKVPPKPVDFINSLSNTAGFYISQFLNLENKNNNLSHRGFVVEMGLLLAKSELLLNKEEWILLGGVDQLLPSDDFNRCILGLDESIPLGQGSNWMLLNKSSKAALARIDLTNKELDKTQLKTYLKQLGYQSHNTQLGFAMLTDKPVIAELLMETGCKKFDYQTNVGFYETMAFYAINQFVLNETGRLIFIDCFLDKYRVVDVNVL